MKLITFLLACLIALPCFALDITDTVNKLPDMKQGLGYSIADDEIEYLSTFEVLNYKDLALEAGFIGDNGVAATVGINIIKLKDYISIPYLKELECNVGYFVGFRRLGITSGNNEYVHGPCVTMLNLEF